MRRFWYGFALASVIALATGCGGGNLEEGEGTETNSGAVSTNYIAMRADGMVPGNLVISVGESVTVRNDTDVNHSFTSEDGRWTDVVLQPGQTWDYTFRVAGTYAYHDRLEGDTWSGTIIVEVSLFRTLGFVALCALLVIACGGKQNHGRGDDGPLYIMMGPLEDTARVYLLDLADVLVHNIDDPEAAMDRMEALLRVNGDAMLENARAIEERYQSLEGAERFRYERELVAFLQDANDQWRRARGLFLERNPDIGRRIERIVDDFDAQ